MSPFCARLGGVLLAGKRRQEIERALQQELRFARIYDPWGDLVNGYQDMTVTATRYRTFVAAMESFATAANAPAPAPV